MQKPGASNLIFMLSQSGRLLAEMFVTLPGVQRAKGIWRTLRSFVQARLCMMKFQISISQRSSLLESELLSLHQRGKSESLECVISQARLTTRCRQKLGQSRDDGDNRSVDVIANAMPGQAVLVVDPYACLVGRLEVIGCVSDLPLEINDTIGIEFQALMCGCWQYGRLPIHWASPC